METDWLVLKLKTERFWLIRHKKDQVEYGLGSELVIESFGLNLN